MPRHSKNSTANPVFSYHERKKITDVGTLKERLGKNSMRSFEQCWICLRTAECPVSTPYGYIYCKMCIVNNLLVQKKIFLKEKKKEYNDYLKEMKTRKKKKDLLQKEIEKKKFINEQENFHTKSHFKSEEQATSTNLSNNFWIVNNSKVKKDAIQKHIKSPTCKLVCPISGKSLKLKDLLTINPETLDNTNSDNNNKWVCSFSKKNIDHHKAILIKKTGQVILKSVFEKFIYGKKNLFEFEVGEDDFIELQPGETAFCSHNTVEKTLYREPIP
ncbi:conserved protein, unknown function [Hepatocystis sp. ex Piliocolobus tephrosceles]|nr:conserved protein, unknown function [Hepatocystis sp. ex Piliocolobus tephrosceles]